jgi:hypothetical protein
MSRHPSDLTDYENVRGEMKTGDVILFSGKGKFSDIIKWRFRKPYSHVAMVLTANMGAGMGQSVLVIESTMSSSMPDVETGAVVKGVQIHWLSKLIEFYNGGCKAWWLPLKFPLEEDEERRMTSWLRQVHNSRVPYDLCQAIGAGINFWDSFLENDADFSRLFCSELVTKALQVAGRVSEEVNPSETAPHEVLEFGCFGVPYQILGV